LSVFQIRPHTFTQMASNHDPPTFIGKNTTLRSQPTHLKSWLSHTVFPWFMPSDLSGSQFAPCKREMIARVLPQGAVIRIQWNDTTKGEPTTIIRYCGFEIWHSHSSLNWFCSPTGKYVVRLRPYYYYY
jgi:hypothetical protein